MDISELDSLILEMITKLVKKHGEVVKEVASFCQEFEKEEDKVKNIEIYLKKVLPSDLKAINLSERINLLSLIKPFQDNDYKEKFSDTILKSSEVMNKVEINLKNMTDIIIKELKKNKF